LRETQEHALQLGAQRGDIAVGFLAQRRDDIAGDVTQLADLLVQVTFSRSSRRNFSVTAALKTSRA
jgi:hypothetical protein